MYTWWLQVQFPVEKFIYWFNIKKWIQSMMSCSFSTDIYDVPCAGCGEIVGVMLRMSGSDGWMPEWVKVDFYVQKVFTCGMMIDNSGSDTCTYTNTVNNWTESYHVLTHCKMCMMADAISISLSICVLPCDIFTQPCMFMYNLYMYEIVSAQ